MERGDRSAANGSLVASVQSGQQTTYHRRPVEIRGIGAGELGGGGWLTPAGGGCVTMPPSRDERTRTDLAGVWLPAVGAEGGQ